MSCQVRADLRARASPAAPGSSCCTHRRAGAGTTDSRNLQMAVPGPADQFVLASRRGQSRGVEDVYRACGRECVCVCPGAFCVTTSPREMLAFPKTLQPQPARPHSSHDRHVYCFCILFFSPCIGAASLGVIIRFTSSAVRGRALPPDPGKHAFQLSTPRLVLQICDLNTANSLSQRCRADSHHPADAPRATAKIVARWDRFISLAPCTSAHLHRPPLWVGDLT